MVIEMPDDGDRSTALLISSAAHWLEFLPAEGVALCCGVCAGLRQAAEEDRLWKDLCHRRWRRVNVDVARPNYRKSDGGGGVIGGHQAAYASLNGWRDPTNRLRRTILSTAPNDAVTGRRFTRGAQAAAPGVGHATNISGMDVGPCRVVVCSADFAWYYNVRQGSNTSRQRRQQPRDATSGSASIDSSGGDGQNGGGGAAESIVGSSSGAAGSSRTLRGFQLPSSGVTEARFSGDGERCFFGTVSGHIFVHECGGDYDDKDGKRHRSPEAIEPWTPTLALSSPTGNPVAVRQVVARFEGGCLGGSRLGVLCRPTLAWQPNLEGSGEGGFLFLVDTQAQAVTRQMNLGGGSLGGLTFPPMERGGTAVSMAPLSSEGMPFGSSGSGELFAVGFGGGTVAVFDARCHEGGGMVGGFITRHRWLKRLRSAGPLLMASYGRTKNIETWDMRRLPSRPTHEPSPSLPIPRLRAPPCLADLACPANSPDFWVEPHGLCVAVHGAPRHSQRFGAKHAFWAWPRQTGGVATVSTDPAAPACSATGGGGGVEIPGRCVVVPGVVNDSGYRMCLSTGVKFTDTHMATVLDSSRVLVGEMSAMPRVARGSGDREGADVTSLFLAA
ncbi:unnamed protein product [Ectocarpus sp. 4 AP-2014]